MRSDEADRLAAIAEKHNALQAKHRLQASPPVVPPLCCSANKASEQ
jgi:hypothetical protein